MWLHKHTGAAQTDRGQCRHSAKDSQGKGGTVLKRKTKSVRACVTSYDHKSTETSEEVSHKRQHPQPLTLHCPKNSEA